MIFVLHERSPVFPAQFHAAHEATGPIISVRDAVFVLKEQRREYIA